MEEILMEEILMEENAFDEIIEAAVSHGICVSNLSYAISKEIALPQDVCQEMAMAGMLHDIGKIRLAAYLYNPNLQTMQIEQMKYVRMHANLSYDIAKEQGFSTFIQESVLYHHENYDGSGYPNNLSGEEIPLGARILRVSDVFGALISNRPYRKAFSVKTALELMIDEVKNFDMQIFLAFQRVINESDIDKLIGCSGSVMK